MNERIYELAQQAGEYARKYVADCKHYGYYMEHNEYDLQFEQKFAELIVRECNQAVLAVPCYYKDYRSQIEEAVIHDCARTVLEHFGVEDANKN